jgi:SAM-dependent methyltransferase
MKIVVYWIRRARESGLKAAVEIAWAGIRGKCFDWYYGTDTFTRIPLEQLAINSANKLHGTKYDPSPIGAFGLILKQLTISPADGFVDFGCGKGRTLLQAAQFPFKRVVGVEFSGELCQIARSNIAKFNSKQPARCHSEVIEIDATQFVITPDLRFFYFYNPFDAEVMRKVCANIEASWREHPRPIMLIYGYPTQRAVVEEFKLFQLKADHEILARHFLIYETPETASVAERKA